MVFAKKAQSKTNIDQMVGLFITIVVNNIINLTALLIRHFVWHPVPVNTAGIVLFFFGGSLNSFLGRGLLFTSVAMLGAARAGLLKSFVPVFALFGGVVILGERLGRMTWLGIGIVLFGLFLMSFDSVRRSGKSQDTAGDRLQTIKGLLVGLFAALFLGSGNVCRKAGITLIPDTVLANTYCSLFAIIVCAIVLLIRGKGREMVAVVRHFDINYGIAGLFTTGALYSLFMSMRYIPISIANSLSAIEPLFTILFVWLFGLGKKEKVGIQILFFGIIMVIGTIIIIIK